jgi:hypothetical protein
LIVILDQFEEFLRPISIVGRNDARFFDQLAQALHDSPTMKVAFVMREEYIAQLEPFAELLPEKLRPTHAFGATARQRGAFRSGANLFRTAAFPSIRTQRTN